MGVEIERKFLVKSTECTRGINGMFYRQGYFIREAHIHARVRIVGDKTILTFKGPPKDLRRAEFEFEIPYYDGVQMIDELCGDYIVEKTRYTLEHKKHIWVIDIFHGSNSGLILAEIELMAAEEEFEQPDWLGEEVTHDARYINANLAEFPYNTWAEERL